MCALGDLAIFLDCFMVEKRRDDLPQRISDYEQAFLSKTAFLCWNCVTRHLRFNIKRNVGFLKLFSNKTSKMLLKRFWQICWTILFRDPVKWSAFWNFKAHCWTARRCFPARCAKLKWPARPRPCLRLLSPRPIAQPLPVGESRVKCSASQHGIN